MAFLILNNIIYLRIFIYYLSRIVISDLNVGVLLKHLMKDSKMNFRIFFYFLTIEYHTFVFNTYFTVYLIKRFPTESTF